MSKRILITVIFLLSLVFAVNIKAETETMDYIVNGYVYTAVKDSTTKSVAILTPYYYKIGETQYEIYMSSKTGSCFINKISKKTGNSYRYYLGEGISKDVCNKMGVAYTPRKK